jgi:hypothetical protein
MDKRSRSPNYPAIGLREALERVTALYKKQHTHSAPREVVAKGIGYQSLNGASATAISALNKYGLLERTGDEIKVSERALSILHPHSDDERAAAIRQAAGEPQLFAELNERFPSPPFPSEDLLRNYLIRKGFTPPAVTGVILAYRDTIEFVQQEAGAYDSRVEPNQEPATMHSATMQTVPQKGAQSIDIKGKERLLARYDFEGGGYIQIVVSDPVSTDEGVRMGKILLELKEKELALRTGQERANVPSSSPSPEKVVDNQNDRNT